MKGNQPTLHTEIAGYFIEPPPGETATFCDSDKGHGRIKPRHYAVSHNVDWLSGDRRYPGETRFAELTAIAMVEATVEKNGGAATQRRYYLSSSALSAERLAEAVRGHWGIENSLHRVLDVIFKEDQSRLRRGHGARNMAVVRHFAINLVRLGKGNRSIKTMRKVAGWDTDELVRILSPSGVNPDSLPWHKDLQACTAVGRAIHFDHDASRSQQGATSGA